MIQQTFEELSSTGQLPTPSGVGMQILKLTQGDDFSTEEIAQAISADAALTGRLLKLANSAESGSVEPITTVGEATIRLGISTVRNVALGLSLVSANRSGKCIPFDYDRYWSGSLARAVAAQRLSRELRIGVPAEMYILALLCDVGSLALACVHPEKYGELLGTPEFDDVEQRLAAETESFEIDHLEVAACMLVEWGLPEPFSVAVRKYEFVHFSDLDGGLENPIHLLQAADLIARSCLADDSLHLTGWEKLNGELSALAGSIELETPFESICDGIVAEWQEWGHVLKVPTQDPVRLGAIEAKITELRESPSKSAEVPAKSSVATPACPDPFGSTQDGLRILAVDDDPLSLKMLERHLIKAGHQVTTAKDGEEALQLALEECPQLVVADWMMPELDGLELCQALRRIASGRRIYYLLLTGRGDDANIIEAFEAGVDDYVVKPFKPGILLARLQAGRRIISLQAQLEREKAIQKKQNAELQIVTRKLRSAALTDPLTELPNRRYAMKRMAQAWESSSRTGNPVSLIMMDIDFFKKVNDEYGHDAGDAVLKETARCLAETSREEEDICRIGGEEFLVICSNADADQAAAAAERLRKAVEHNLVHWNDYHRAVTLSLGVAVRGEGTANAEEVLKAADEAVYEAKENGRNQVVISKTEGGERKTA
jgi:two-component system, cell cycle response regulator